MSFIERLAPLRNQPGTRLTSGLDDATLTALSANHPQLIAAVDAAAEEFARVQADLGPLLAQDEQAQIDAMQDGFVNFYADDAVTPYVALAARGPWVVTLKGAVLYDAGGYGMLGFGHTPDAVLEAMARPQVMANIMTPSLSQQRFITALRAEIGHRRGGCPFARFMCLNSGSEAVGLAARIADVNAKLQTDPGARHAGAAIKRVVVKGSFHGRTDRPALYSDSSRKSYMQHLASYRGEDSVITVAPYDEAGLRKVFEDATRNQWFIEAVFLEPVMGEGDPGRSVPPSFYTVARELTRAHGSLLLLDSIQAGLRAHGVLSVVDYPGFEGLDPPDMETYSKALNAAQYPLSVLAVTEHAAQLYRKGIYGNTMTSNPRALDVACATLAQLTPQVRANIAERGAEAVRKLEQLKNELGGLITKVQGTGLLFSCELAPQFKCYGANSTEEWLRQHGINVIHGGENSLRFTPHFGMDSEELDLLVGMVGRALREGPRREQAAAA
ncbi:TPA: aminotransferase class III-fold pyridoxal phosphate-dependent enzyme [Stenotrophomonas maltophilia]|uniref:aminotransferase class III-fold pyridoxal phosphate-dependent enzyme n=1 Tax=Stenotrophomonas TaxID=40323 RepID=UPI000F7A4310|nr:MULTISPECIES: aminotransferase class III-fold pyridoxal phosphate-dependent enzyme [Stenotrophomonas]MBA0419852.1 aminotransferase class III-fold pyridoxal phosphate-dependent enzyme [Stenotrophomonas maltophilia]MBD3741635.1 aminotransferase class III-fold pyridoxal phosphate-dependent enzyme [Stenotrophomonas sp.]RRU75521.1 aminotransferase class III-fold pyridoxal phosphate-dependent enzyme [Stenotrophomonas maltophilia]HEL5029007.1 aminotransferase class III-fold pyridoxal phosphate-depe